MMTDSQHPQIANTDSLPDSAGEKSKAIRLGLAGRMAQAFIHSPLSLLFFLTMLFMGIMGLIFTPRQEDPQISVPMVDIFVQYPGAAAGQVAHLAIEPLQRILSEIPGVKHVYSMTDRASGIVTVEFEVGEVLENSIFKVHDKIQSNMEKIPPGVMPPLVKPKGVDDVPVVNLTLWSDTVDDGALRTLALDVMQSLKEVTNTGQSFVVGGRAEQVRIEVVPEKLAGYNISLGQIAQTIQTANSEKTAGYIETGDTNFTVHTGAFLQNAQEIERLVVGTYQNSPIYVRDVATVTHDREEPRQMAHYFSGPAYHYDQYDKHTPAPVVNINAAPAVTIAVSKKVGTNGVTVANAILAHVEHLKGRLIPDNVRVEVTRNYGQTANDKVNDLIKKLFIATGAVTLLVWFALGLRPAIVVTLVIPVVILITVFSAWVLGYTIDRVSLFALIFSIGILVDDAIVVIENIYRRWLLRGETDTVTAVDAVREVGNPTILATFTVVAALLPMGFVSGMMGPYMEPIPALGSVAMVFSLFAAFMFTPWLAMRFKPSLASLRQASEKEHLHNEKLEKFFRRILPPLFTSRVLGFLFLFALIFSFFAACSMFYYEAVEVKMLPLDNKPEFNVFIDMPEGTALPMTANTTFKLASKLREIPEVTALQTYVGTSQPFDFNGMVRHYYLRQQPWQADIHVQLKFRQDRERSSHEIALEARRMLKELIKDTPVKISVVEMPPGPPVLQSIVAEVYGPDDDTRREVAHRMTEAFKQATILGDVDNYMSEPYERWQFEVDTEKAVRRGITVDTINQNLSMALGGFKVGDIKQGTMLEPTYIVIQVPLAVRAQLNRLLDLPIPTNMGNTVPLAELGRFTKITHDPLIFQKDLRPIEYVVGEAVGVYEGNNQYRLSAPIYGMWEIETLLKDYVTPDGVKIATDGCRHYLGGLVYLCWPYIGRPDVGRSGYEWTGEWTVTYETFRDMGLAFCAAMVLIYILVVWLFGNFIVPAIIMVPIPLTLLGIIPGHWFLDAEFTATSMIGWIALAGIIVRNSILLVDYSIHEIERGTLIQDAVILACKTRTRPIMITAFALVAGSSVILFDPIFQGMAISLLFGVMVSTLLTLVVIPLGCISIGPKALCGNAVIHDDFVTATQQPTYSIPLWLRIWIAVVNFILTIINIIKTIVNFIKIVFYIIRAPFLLLWGIWSNRAKPTPPAPPPVTSPPPSPSSGSGGGIPPSPVTPVVPPTPAAPVVPPTPVAAPATALNSSSSAASVTPAAAPSELTPTDSPAPGVTADLLKPVTAPSSATPAVSSEPIAEIAAKDVNSVPVTPVPVIAEKGNNVKPTTLKKTVSRRGIRLKTDITPDERMNGDAEEKPIDDGSKKR